MEAFKKELELLINKHGIENKVDMPDFLLAELFCNLIEPIGRSTKLNLDWHGCDSVCHSAPNVKHHPERGGASDRVDALVGDYFLVSPPEL